MTCILVIASVPLSSAENPQYTACSIPYSCGRHIQSVGYPFWGDNRPKFCGISDFKLRCDEFNPVMEVFQNGNVSLSLGVLGINTSSHTIDFTLYEAFTNCVPPTNKLTYLPTLKPDTGYSIISLLYGCNSKCYSRYYSKSLSCTNSDGAYGNAYYMGDTSGVRMGS